MVIVIYISSSNIICGDEYCFIICTQDWFIIFYPYDKEWFGFIRSYYKLKFENTTKRLDFLLKSTGKNLFLAIQLLSEFDFGHATPKPGILNHRTIKTVHIRPSDGFAGWFQ